MDLELVDQAGIEILLNGARTARDQDVPVTGYGTGLIEGAFDAVGDEGEGRLTLPDPWFAWVVGEAEHGRPERQGIRPANLAFLEHPLAHHIGTHVEVFVGDLVVLVGLPAPEALTLAPALDVVDPLVDSPAPSDMPMSTTTFLISLLLSDAATGCSTDLAVIAAYTRVRRRRQSQSSADVNRSLAAAAEVLGVPPSLCGDEVEDLERGNNAGLGRGVGPPRGVSWRTRAPVYARDAMGCGIVVVVADVGIVDVALRCLVAAWTVVEGIDTVGSLRERRREQVFSKRAVKRAVVALSEKGSMESRAAARILGDKAFAAFAVDPENPVRREALNPQLVLDAVGPGCDVERVLSVLAEAFCAAALAEASPGERVVAGKVDRVEDTALQVMDIAADLHPKVDRAQAALDVLVRRGRTDLVDLLDGESFVAQDADLGRLRMASDVTAGAVPAYVPRDVDPVLDELLAAALEGAADRFAAVAGGTKTGKSRCLLAALSRVAPLHVVLPVRRAHGRDTVNELLAVLREDPPGQPWVVLVEDLYEHLSGGMNLAAAVAATGAVEPAGCVVATTSRRALNVTDAQRQTDQLSVSDLDLIDAHHVELGRVASSGEQRRARHAFASELATGAIAAEDLMHFPERLAAIPQLLRQVDQAISELPDTSPQVALTLAACQLSLGRATRLAGRQELRQRAVCVHRHLPPHERRLGPLTDQLLDEAESWAAQRVGATYALLMPHEANDDEVELLDAVLDHVGHQALLPSFDPCAPDDPRQLIQLGAEAFSRYADTETAIHWTTRAATQTGHPIAMYNLGVLLEARGDETSVVEAEQWYRRATSQNVRVAMQRLGVLLQVRGNEDEAEHWYRRAAELNHAASIYNLGVLLHQRGDKDEAEQWWRRAAEQNHAEAMNNLGVLLQARGDEDEAEQWWRRAADQDHAGSMYSLAVVLETRGDDDEAEQWYRRAAEQNHIAATFNLGVLLHRRGDKAGVTEAEHWYRRAAEQNDADAMHGLGVLLHRRGDKAGVTEAEHWYRRAAEQNHTAAMHNLGVLLQARGDADEAEQWYRRAADDGRIR